MSMSMSARRGVRFSRRDVLSRLAALAASVALPRQAWAFLASDPLDGAIAEYVAGLRNGRWSAAEITSRALDRCRANGRAWLVHCYGMLGAGRDTAPDSGGGAELYVVIGHAPRHLDRNVTLLGRVVSGMDLLSSIPRGPAPMGFFEKPEMRVPIRSIKVAADVPETERTNLEMFRTDTAAFTALVESRRNRREEWFKNPAGHIELCNVPLPVRPVGSVHSGRTAHTKRNGSGSLRRS